MRVKRQKKLGQATPMDDVARLARFAGLPEDNDIRIAICWFYPTTGSWTREEPGGAKSPGTNMEPLPDKDDPSKSNDTPHYMSTESSGNILDSYAGGGENRAAHGVSPRPEALRARLVSVVRRISYGLRTKDVDPGYRRGFADARTQFRDKLLKQLEAGK